MATAVENPLEDLLRHEVEGSPLGQRLGLILPEKIARTIGCSRRTLDREIERGRIGVFRIATRTYVPLDALIAWWDQSQSRSCRAIRKSDAQSKVRPQSRTHRGVQRQSAQVMSRKAAR